MSPSPGTRATILLVEDRDALRDLYQAILETDAYAVLPAEAGAQALLIAAQQARPVDLLVTDLVMPGMGGLELARRLRASVPAVKVLYISGHADEATLAAHEEGALLLRKPIAFDALRAAVRVLLGRGSTGRPPSAAGDTQF
jgi:two-component system, cell cycle sensor histidine kinase and response regulator CckA